MQFRLFASTVVFTLCLLLLSRGTASAQLPCDCLRVGSTPEANADDLHSITFAFGRFIAVGNAGAVVTSTNGVTWLRQLTPITSGLYGVTSCSNGVIAGGDGGCVLWSTNGIDWKLCNAGATNNIRAIAYGNGQFVALTSQSTLLVSSNAASWASSLSATPYGWPLYGLFFAGGSFFACGGNGMVLTSADGLNWTPQFLPLWCNFNCGAYGNGVIVLAGQNLGYGQAACSTNGLSWTPLQLRYNFNALCFGGGLFLGGFAGGGAGCFQWSSDGKSWTNVVVGVSIRGIAYGLGQYAAVGDGGGILTATDPSAWTTRNATVCPIAAFAEGNGLSVGISGDYAVIYSSEDKVHYTCRRPPGGVLTSVDFGNGLFVTAGNVGFLVSSDSTNWTSVLTPSIGDLPAVFYRHGIWVAVYHGIISSENGTNWLLRVANPGYLTGLIYGNNRFVGFGWNGAIWSSTDATNWQNCSYSTQANLGPAVFFDGLFSLFGQMSYMLPESALVSPDGLNWFDPAKKGPLLALHQASTNAFRLSLAGNWNAVYPIQATTNLHLWSPIAALTNSAGVTSLVVTNQRNNAASFFRAGPN